MKSWLAKICMLVAVMLITAHNIIPHDHVAQSTAHEHHQHTDNEKVFSHDLLAHSFVQRAAAFTVVQQIVVDVPLPLVVAVGPVVTCKPCGQYVKKSYSIRRGNLPPPLYSYSSVSFRGPPHFC